MKETTISEKLAAASVIKTLAAVTEDIEQLEMFDIAQDRRKYAAAELNNTIAHLAQIEWEIRGASQQTTTVELHHEKPNRKEKN
ncbi:MAG: hypothetical protein HY508_10840 [Acidobacteria bacterium]|nr:hypothetical protein [Acidobacteriota bacterium]